MNGGAKLVDWLLLSPHLVLQVFQAMKCPQRPIPDFHCCLLQSQPYVTDIQELLEVCNLKGVGYSYPY